MRQPFRILHLFLASDAGGLSRYILNLGTAMHALGHDIHVAGDTGVWQKYFDESPLKYTTIPLRDGLIDFWTSVRTMRQFMQSQPIDLIHTHYRRATLLGRRLQHRQPGKRIPLIYTVHLSHLSLRFPRNLLSDFGDVTHVASPEARDWVVEDGHVPGSRVAFIPHGIPIEQFPLRDDSTMLEARRSFGFRPDDAVAVYAGRLDFPKNEEWMIDLAARAKGRIPNLKVILVGEGPHDAMLHERARQLGVSDRVVLPGHQNPLRSYQAADLLCLPSIHEGFSYVCAEAMSTGVPILRTRTAGTRQLVIEGVTGRSVPIEKEAFLSAAMEMLSDRAKLRDMGLAASKHVRAHYTYQQQLDATLELYARLLRK